jgi:hypothetical protein
MALGTAVLCVITGVVWAWYLTRGPGAVVVSLKRLWLELPGAVYAKGLVYVHHGKQPLWIRCGKDKAGISVSIHTPLADSAVAFRMGPKSGTSLPAMGPLGLAHGGPPVERAVHLEMRFANTFHVESSDERAADRLITEEVAVAILEVFERAPRGFRGVSYDGQHLGISFGGSVAADPQQATNLARLIWASLGEDD